MSYQKDKHDTGLKRADGSTIGLMLVRDKNNIPQYFVDDDEYIAEAERGQSRAERELPPIMQDDWRSGFGLEVYDPDDPKRYYKAIKADLRHRGMAIAGPKATAVTIGYGGDAITNYDMETAASGWTGGGNGARDAGQAHGGGFSWKLPGGVMEDWQVITWSNDFQGLKVKFWCWVYSTGANEGRIGINDGVAASTYSSYHTGVAGWELLSVEHTMDASATQLHLLLYNAVNASYFDDAGCTSLGYPTAFAEFNGSLYIAIGQALYRVDSSGVFTVRQGFGVDITDLEVFTDSRLYIALGTSNNYFYMSTAEAFTESDSKAYFFCAVGTTMWKALLPRDIDSATNPILDANWSGVTTVDSTYHNILELLTDGSTIVIKKADRAFYVDSGGAVQILIGETKHLVGDTSTKRSACEWQKKYYFGYGSQSLIEYDGGTITWRSPAKYCTNLAEFVGEVQALAGDEEYLHAIVDYSTSVEILTGRSETIDGTTSWVWHPISEITLAGCELCFVSSVYKKRLWIASTSSGDGLYYIPLTTKYGDILNDSDYEFQTGGEFWTPWLHGNFRGDPKAWIKLILEMGHTYNANRYFTVSYQEFGGSVVSIGNYTGSGTSMIESKFIDITNKPDEVMIRFKFVPVTNSTSETPILKSYDCRAILYPTRRRIIRALIRCADDITDKLGSPLESDATTIKAALEEAADTTASHWPVEFYDIYGTTKNIRLLATPEFIRVARQERDKNPELHIRLIGQEVALA